MREYGGGGGGGGERGMEITVPSADVTICRYAAMLKVHAVVAIL